MTFFLVPRFLETRRVGARALLAASLAFGVGATVLADQGMPSLSPSNALPSVTVSWHGATRTPAPRQERGMDTMEVGGVTVTTEDGLILDGQPLSPFDEDVPALANLDPDLLAAVQEAATDAEAEGIVMLVNSGWRSKTYQQALMEEAIITYGSAEEAQKWVASPEKSSHVTGDAVDIAYTDADYWLIEHGADYGLCQAYANEVWHFELLTEPGGTCPAPIEDASAG